MSATIELDVKKLAAALLLAAKKDVRYYLNAVYVEATENETRLTATDGHVLGTFRRKAPNALDGETKLTCLIAREHVEHIIKSRVGIAELCLDDAGQWSMLAAGSRLSFAPVDGKFPDYRAVIPRRDQAPAIAHFNPELLAIFSKVARTLAGPKACAPWVQQFGDSAALITLEGNDDFTGVCMPMRGPKAYASTSWATGELA